MPDADFALLMRHLGSVGAKGRACPVCETASWRADGPFGLMVLTPDPERSTAVIVGPKVVPMVLLICNKCSYTMQFAWAEIKKNGP